MHVYKVSDPSSLPQAVANQSCTPSLSVASASVARGCPAFPDLNHHVSYHIHRQCVQNFPAYWPIWVDFADAVTQRKCSSSRLTDEH